MFLAPIEILTIAQNLKLTNVQRTSKDFRTISVEEEKQKSEERNGRIVTVVTSTEYLFPQKAGKLLLPELSLDAIFLVQTRENSIFGFFGGFAKEVKKHFVSSPKEFLIKELPAEGNQEFSDLVGKFLLTTNLSTPELQVGDTTTITVTLEGDSAFDAMKPLKLMFPIEGKVYADKAVVDEKATMDGYHAKLTQKFAFVPAKSFSGNLGSLKIKIFNPEKKTLRNT